MGWRENKNNYVKSYMKEKYYRINLQFRKDDKNDVDYLIWQAIKDEPNKAGAIKKLLFKAVNSK